MFHVGTTVSSAKHQNWTNYICAQVQAQIKHFHSTAASKSPA